MGRSPLSVNYWPVSPLSFRNSETGFTLGWDDWVKVRSRGYSQPDSHSLYVMSTGKVKMKWRVVGIPRLFLGFWIWHKINRRTSRVWCDPPPWTDDSLVSLCDSEMVSNGVLPYKYRVKTGYLVLVFKWTLVCPWIPLSRPRKIQRTKTTLSYPVDLDNNSWMPVFLQSVVVFLPSRPSIFLVSGNYYNDLVVHSENFNVKTIEVFIGLVYLSHFYRDNYYYYYMEMTLWLFVCLIRSRKICKSIEGTIFGTVNPESRSFRSRVFVSRSLVSEKTVGLTGWRTDSLEKPT